MRGTLLESRDEKEPTADRDSIFQKGHYRIRDLEGLDQPCARIVTGEASCHSTHAAQHSSEHNGLIRGRAQRSARQPAECKPSDETQRRLSAGRLGELVHYELDNRTRSKDI